MSISQLPPDASAAVGPAAAVELLGAAVDALVGADPTTATVAELGDLLVRLQTRLDAVHDVASEWTMAFESAGGPEDAGSPTLAAWSRQHLRLTGHEARRRTRAGQALRELPATRAAVAEGQIGTGHLDAIGHGVRLLGPAVMAAAEPIILDVAKVCDADAVKQTITKLRDTLDPDAETGAAFQQVLYAAAKPVGADDPRTAGQRRVDGLRDLCRAALDHGLPSDRGLRPHLYVTVTADRLHTATGSRIPRPSNRPEQTSAAVHEPALLHGFGPIADSLLAKLACDAVATQVVVDHPGPHPTVLDVGRTARLATLKQRQAVITAQGGGCFNPGCDRTHLEIHHMVPWSLGGPTDLGNLRGYCTRCHHLIHLGLLIVKPDHDGGWTHRANSGQCLIDHRRRQHHRTHRWTAALLAGGLDHANNEIAPWRPPRATKTPPRSGDPPPDAT